MTLANLLHSNLRHQSRLLLLLHKLHLHHRDRYPTYRTVTTRVTAEAARSTLTWRVMLTTLRQPLHRPRGRPSHRHTLPRYLNITNRPLQSPQSQTNNTANSPVPATPSLTKQIAQTTPMQPLTLTIIPHLQAAIHKALPCTALPLLQLLDIMHHARLKSITFQNQQTLLFR